VAKTEKEKPIYNIGLYRRKLLWTRFLSYLFV